ncbi:Acid protease [Purpureocillium lilacinum]|uniref:Acid protease n=1 Tax=Purpureocillium lilacinum TaxID=33203 RepID=A0A179HF17_PURLI|nr:Acid protease [Purpureocillium lilacinum]OAQ79624.1 Acid protease [Purpureocillium lilacinum]OAQ88976.1 Acid protease [Purpureocillium lilacinum]PWI74162.1 hypothetical protein PCL_09438 [Purpureocillium lilacinum]GJN73925.1 hypothetical protein PLICBS_008009 [Purpureocillium lilacinum]
MRIPSLRARASDPAPVAVSASQFFEGIDGPWSTFELRVGTPAQNIRFLPGTSSTLTTVVLPEGCQGQSKDCAENRGGVFNKTASTTWSEIGLFNLGFEKGLGYNDNGDFGHDTVGLGYLGSGGPVVNNSIVAGVAGSEFYLSVLGLKPEPTNFTTQNDPQPSFMELLKKQGKIPSLSYSYTAGAPYRLNKALGSLVLGGYDTSKFEDTNKTHHFFSDQSRDLTVGIQSITTNATGDESSLLPSGLINSYIDSSIAELYLPLDACQAFEKAFGLDYNETAGMYFVDDKLHSKLTKDNPSVTLSITTAVEGGDSFNVTLPYASFDLQAKPPRVKNETRYFPLKRADNDTQYTLGRTFLQEAYLVVDYERSSFAVHPRVWNASAVSHVVAILPPSDETSAPTAPSADMGNSGLSSGAIAGASVGAIVAFVLLIILPLWFFLIVPRRRRAAEMKSAKSEQAAASSTDGAEGAAAAASSGETPEDERTAEIEGDTPKPEVEGDTPRPEVEGDTPTPEVEGSKPTPEVEGSTPTPEVEGSEPTPKGTMSELGAGTMSELPTPYSPQPAELFTPPPELLGVEIHEMPGSDVPELPGSEVPHTERKEDGV